MLINVTPLTASGITQPQAQDPRPGTTSTEYVSTEQSLMHNLQGSSQDHQWSTESRRFGLMANLESFLFQAMWHESTSKFLSLTLASMWCRYKRWHAVGCIP